MTRNDHGTTNAEQAEKNLCEPEAGQLAAILERVERLEETVEQQAERIDELEHTVERQADRIDELESDQQETDDKADANRASLVGIINDVRGYEGDERLGLKASNGRLHQEAKNTGAELYDTIQRSEDLEGLAEFRESLEDNARSRSKVESQLAVLERATEFAETNDQNIVRFNYRQISNIYGCNERYAYTVMETMAEEVPGCLHKDGRTLGPETHGVGGQHLEIQLAHPELRGWLRARK